MKVLALFSGGLDSLISMKLLKDLGFDVSAVHFNIGFGANKDKKEYLKNATMQVNVPLVVLDIRKQFFDNVLFTPKYGYGRFFNPCIDCHANMFKQAFYYLASLKDENGNSVKGFVISGEVLGQRPKSQRKEALDQVKSIVRSIEDDPVFAHLIDKSGNDKNKPMHLDELLLRPMSAKLMAPSFMERAGIIDTSALLDISGRGRNRQLEMAKNYGFKYYEKPGGGCLLTDINVSKKLKDLSGTRKLELADIALVKSGRYMILPSGARLIIARNDTENAKLDQNYQNMSKIVLLDVVGPIGFISNDASRSDLLLAGAITLGYGKSTLGQTYNVKIGENEYALSPLDKLEAKKFLLD